MNRIRCVATLLVAVALTGCVIDDLNEPGDPTNTIIEQASSLIYVDFADGCKEYISCQNPYYGNHPTFYARTCYGSGHAHAESWCWNHCPGTNCNSGNIFNLGQF